ncbi:GIY-YIG nuclease family protein [Paenibacillus gansuensis]|uniref:GIY-YIG nuclease family protein n=1 Tax=Paenibacillus gansuensis TaxID=306542 RepID=A0ABW5PDA5_9BACL
MSFTFVAADYPEKPGCYLMRDSGGRILYVGKSKNLRNRLRSYFTQHHQKRRLIELVANIDSIEIVLVNNEPESLMLENNLIKIHKPPYNRALKRDNSGFAYLQMVSDPLPRLDVYYRDRRPKGARTTAGSIDQVQDQEKMSLRFGPYVSSRFQHAVMDFVTDHYKLRTCTTLPKRACLLYHIGKCSGVCEGHISKKDYMESAQQTADMLQHRNDQLIGAMKAKMEWYADRLEYEKAEHILRHIRILERIPEKQIVDRETKWNQDVLYFGETGVLIASVQEGMLRDFRYIQQSLHEKEDAGCDVFILKYYGADPPDELIVNRVHRPDAVRSQLRHSSRRSVRITEPKRGLKFDLLQLAKANYEFRAGGGQAAAASAHE